MQARIAIALLRNRQVQGALLALVLLVVLMPMLVAAGVAGLFDQQAEATCGGGSETTINPPAGGGALAQGLYAAPLELTPGRWYEVGATEYGGSGDPTSGDYGSIPNPGESYLPAHPDSFAELSVLDSNPANGGTFTFGDANALHNLPTVNTYDGWTQPYSGKFDPFAVSYMQPQSFFPAQSSTSFGNSTRYNPKFRSWHQFNETVGLSRTFRSEERRVGK